MIGAESMESYKLKESVNNSERQKEYWDTAIGLQLRSDQMML